MLVLLQSLSAWSISYNVSPSTMETDLVILNRPHLAIRLSGVCCLVSCVQFVSERAGNIVTECGRLSRDQDLQVKGWKAVTANLRATEEWVNARWLQPGNRMFFDWRNVWICDWQCVVFPLQSLMKDHLVRRVHVKLNVVVLRKKECEMNTRTRGRERERERERERDGDSSSFSWFCIFVLLFLHSRAFRSQHQSVLDQCRAFFAKREQYLAQVDIFDAQLEKLRSIILPPCLRGSLTSSMTASALRVSSTNGEAAVPEVSIGGETLSLFDWIQAQVGLFLGELFFC